MPELAEVEFFRRQWASALGDRVTKVSLHARSRIFRDTRPYTLRKALEGTRFHSAEAHGKQLLFGFEPGVWIGVQLGMTGRLLLAAPDHVPDRHDHFVLALPSQSLVFRDPRMFGRVRFERSLARPAWWCALPSPILSPGFSRDHVREFFSRHPRPPIKAVLLDQRAFPGIGNWMADEILWRARLHPALPAGELSEEDRERLRRAVRQVSREALEVIGRDWSEPPVTWLFSHRWKDGGSCPRKTCRNPLIREEIRGRTTCWCPICQRG